MKMSLRSVLGKLGFFKNLHTKKQEQEGDKQVSFFYTNIINSIILFSYNSVELDAMASILIDPLTELFEEIEYAFSPVCFETVFRAVLIDNSLKDELLSFKSEVDQIPTEIWNWEFLDSHESWIAIRLKSNLLLEKLGIESRIYNDDYTTIYDYKGNILKSGAKQP